MELIYEVNNLGLFLLTLCLMYAMLCQCFRNCMWICTVSGWRLRRSYQYYHKLFIRSWFIAKYLRFILCESSCISVAKLLLYLSYRHKLAAKSNGPTEFWYNCVRVWFCSCRNFGNVFLYQDFTTYPQLQQCNLSSCLKWPFGMLQNLAVFSYSFRWRGMCWYIPVWSGKIQYLTKDLGLPVKGPYAFHQEICSVLYLDLCWEQCAVYKERGSSQRMEETA